MDVVTAFLNGDLEEEIYVEPPEGFAEQGDYVWRLRKTLYGLKQSPRLWYLTLMTFLLNIGFHRSEYDHALFYKFVGKDVVLLLVYVDDILPIGRLADIKTVKEQLSKKFKMTDLGQATYFIGVEIIRNCEKRTITLS